LNITQHKVALTAMVGLSALLLGACSQSSNSSHSKATSTSQSSAKKHSTEKSFYKKDDSSGKKEASSTSSSTPKQSDASTTSTDTNTDAKKFIFPSRMQGTWFTYTDDHQIQTVTFDGNVWKTNDGSFEAYDGAAQGSEDAESTPDKSKENWTSAGFMDVDDIFKGDENPSKIVNLRGWYQNNGDGTFFHNTTQTVDGTKVEVLTEAGGAMLSTIAHYYKTPALAKAHASDTYYSDHEDRS
jgi:hypothetical protein